MENRKKPLMRTVFNGRAQDAGSALRTAALVALCALAVPGVARAAAVEDPAVSAALQALDAKRATLGRMALPFHHERTSRLFDAPQTREGTLYYDPDAGLALSYEKPEAYALLAKKGRLTMVQPGRRIERLRTGGSSPMAGMMRILQQDMAALPKFFKVVLAPTGPETVRLELTPLRERSGMKRLVLTLAPATGLLQRVEIEEDGDDRQDIRFDPPKQEKPDDARFELKHWAEALGAKGED